ncbi:MAG TPA: sigma factor, partial [Acidimicrobiales bacterium]|nr:sigma factor [Acidimicrobiales bacterium]
MPNTTRLSDANLVRRSQQGDRRAFGALLGRYDRRLRGLAYALLLDPAEMDTALGVAYLRAWRDVVRVAPKDDVGTWLYRATYNACIDMLRRDGRPAPKRVRGLRRGLAGLAPLARVAVVLVDREEFSPTSAARILGVSPAALLERLEVARAALDEHVPAPATPAGAATPAATPAAPAAAAPPLPAPPTTPEGAPGLPEGGVSHPAPAAADPAAPAAVPGAPASEGAPEVPEGGVSHPAAAAADPAA